MKVRGINIYLALVLLITAQLLILFKTSYTVWPEMVLYPYLLSKGFVLYRDIIAPYFPLMVWFLGAIAKIFGESILALKLTTYLVILVTDLVIFYSTSRLTKDKLKALLSVGIYSVLQISYGGNSLWLELFLTPLVIFSLTTVYLDYNSRKKIILTGAALGLAVLVKQNAVFFYLPCIYLLLRKRLYGMVAWLVFPLIVMLLGLFVYLNLSNLTSDFYTWAIKLPSNFTKQPGFISMPAIRQYPYILFPAAAGLVALYFWKTKEKLFWILSLIIALNFAFPRYEDFHLQVLVGLSAVLLVFLPKRFLAAFLLIALVIFGRNEFLHLGKPDRFLDQSTISLSQKISTYDSVYLVNSPELAYFLSGKLPPKPWATNFPWYFEQPNFQEQFVNSLENEKIQYIVVGQRIGGGKYALGNYIPEKVLDFVNSHYAKVENWDSYEIWRLQPF